MSYDWGKTEHNMNKPVAYLYASIAGPVVLHRLAQIGVAKPLFSEKAVDDDLEAANKWPKAHSMIPLYTKPQGEEHMTETERKLDLLLGDALAENERLRRELKYQDARDGHIGTHSPECWTFGPRHYDCAIRHINSMTDDGK